MKKLDNWINGVGRNGEVDQMKALLRHVIVVGGVVAVIVVSTYSLLYTFSN